MALLRSITTILFLLCFTTNKVNCDDEGLGVLDVIFILGNLTKSLINQAIPNGELYIPGKQEIDLDIPMLGGKYRAEDINVTGITNFDFTHLSLDEPGSWQLQLTYNLKFRGIRAILLYGIQTYLAKLVHVKGDGDIDFTFELDIFGHIRIKILEFKIDDVQIQPKIDSQFVVRGLTVGERMSRIVSKQIDDFIETLLNHTLKPLFDGIGLLVKQILNLILEGLITFKVDIPEINHLGELFRKKQRLYKYEL